MLHLVWDLGWFSRTEFTVPRPDLNDGRWHTVEVDRVRQSLELRVDGEVFGSQVLHGLFLIRGIVKIQLVLPLTKIRIFI